MTIIHLPVNVEEWRGMPIVPLDEADTYSSRRIYRVKGKIWSISDYPLNLIELGLADDITIRFQKEGAGTSSLYRLYLQNSSAPNSFAKEVKLALLQLKASQLECIVGVNQRSTLLDKRNVNYLLLPSFFEAVIKNGRVSFLSRYSNA